MSESSKSFWQISIGVLFALALVAALVGLLGSWGNATALTTVFVVLIGALMLVAILPKIHEFSLGPKGVSAKISKLEDDIHSTKEQVSAQKDELDTQRQELNRVNALMFLLEHFLNKRQLDILRNLAGSKPSYWLDIDQGDQFLRLEFSQMLNLGLIESVEEGKWLFDNPGRRDVAEYHRITQQGRRYLTLLRDVDNKRKVS